MRHDLRLTGLVLALALWSFLSEGVARAAPPATCPTIAGTYTFVMEPAKSFSADVLTDAADPGGILTAPRQDVKRVGVFTIDAACGVSGNTLALTDTNSGQTRFIEFNWTGVISAAKGGPAGINPNGKGFLTINDPGAADIVDCEDMTTDPPTDIVPAGTCEADEGKEVYAIVFPRPMSSKEIHGIQIDNVGGGAKIFMQLTTKRQFVAPPPAPAVTCPVIKGHYTFVMEPAKSFSADVLTDGADPSGILTAPRQDVKRVGVLTIDGACGVKGNTLALTDTNSGQTRFIEFNWTGVISAAKGGPAGINPNGKGFLTINDPGAADIVDCEEMTTDPPTDLVPATCEGDEGKEVYAIVLSRPPGNQLGRRDLDGIQIDNVGGGAKIFMQLRAERQ